MGGKSALSRPIKKGPDLALALRALRAPGPGAAPRLVLVPAPAAGSPTARAPGAGPALPAPPRPGPRSPSAPHGLNQAPHQPQLHSPVRPPPPPAPHPDLALDLVLAPAHVLSPRPLTADTKHHHHMQTHILSHTHTHTLDITPTGPACWVFPYEQPFVAPPSFASSVLPVPHSFASFFFSLPFL